MYYALCDFIIVITVKYHRVHLQLFLVVLALICKCYCSIRLLSRKCEI